MKNNRNRLLSNGLFYIVVFLLLLWGINWALGGSNNGGSTENISYSQFVKDLRQGKVKNFSVQPANGVYTVSGSYKNAQTAKNQSNSSFDFFSNNLLFDSCAVILNSKFTSLFSLSTILSVL